MRTALGYTWQIVQSVLQIYVVLHVFSRLDDRFEIIVVSLLVLIYVAMMSSNLNTAYMVANVLSLVEQDIIFIRKRLGDDVSAREKEASAVESKKMHAMNRAGIAGFTYFLIFLVCLYQLFNAL